MDLDEENITNSESFHCILKKLEIEIRMMYSDLRDDVNKELQWYIPTQSKWTSLHKKMGKCMHIYRS